ncbi:Aquaporin-2 [Lachnellula suecica]|uniref:Aquaporin-2 n=1 Tax=Lachnellula suecica TaxID=602035 RepID=A0A8T9C595_9HELO|nr:Aquaporin-2 [Lachnellula suecica]
MNINHVQTILYKRDPLKKAFQTLFETLPATARGHVVAVVGELVGTIFFLWFAFAGAQVASASSNADQGSNVSTATDHKSPQQLLYIALSAGFSLAVFSWTFFRISGGLFNPVASHLSLSILVLVAWFLFTSILTRPYQISLGMALIGAITWARCALLCAAQTIGAIIAAYMVYGLFHGGLNVSTELGGGTTIAQGVMIEMILTSQLAFTIFMLAAEKHAGTFLAPIGIGLSLFIAELVAGTLLAVLLYKLIKALEYESIGVEEEEKDILSQIGSRKPSSIIPLKSVGTGGLEPMLPSPAAKPQRPLSNNSDP